MVNRVHFYSFVTGECLPCAKTKVPKGKRIFSLKGKTLRVKTKVELGGGSGLHLGRPLNSFQPLKYQLAHGRYNSLNRTLVA